MKQVRFLLCTLLLAFTAQLWGQQAPPAAAYHISFPNPADHVAVVNFRPAHTGPELRVQLPVWNALYQIRDFAQHVLSLNAFDRSHQPIIAEKIDKTTWAVPNAAEIEYRIYLDDPGPFGAQVNTDHIFLNLAQVLVYAVGQRPQPEEVTFDGPEEMVRLTGGGTIRAVKPLAVMLKGPDLPCGGRSCGNTIYAPSYDELVDAPVEIGNFQTAMFDLNGGHYRVVVHADPADYNMDSLAGMVKKIVAAEVDWMQDRPFSDYMFIYHFPRGPAAGGMEHANSAAIDVNASAAAEDLDSVASVTAHEFFHLWNVKRIRPKSLQPIDYTRENYTRALWFAEGVNTAVSDSMLVRAGIFDEKQFLRRLADQIAIIQAIPAHRTQSVEESSLDAWFERYSFYRQPERSLSYYIKGQVLGVLLDLSMRQATSGKKSLRELFQFMNQQYAKQGRFYDDSAAIRTATETVCAKDFSSFFNDYVAGTKELPYDSLFETVGLRLHREQRTKSWPGFSSGTNFGPKPIINFVEEGSEASKAGLRQGDAIEYIEGKLPARGFEAQIAAMQPGKQLHLKISNARGTHDVRITLIARQAEEFVLADLDQVTAAQRVRRAAWIRGDSE